MKKFLAIIASAILAVCMFAFAACDNNGNNDNSGVVAGDYKEPTEDELKTTIDDVDEDKIFEGLTGYELDAKFNVNISADGTDSDMAAALNFKVTTANQSLLGTGTASLTSSGDNGMNVNANVYLDSSYAYANVMGLSQVLGSDEFKAKVNYGTLLEGVTGKLPMAAEEEAEPDESLNLAEMLALLDEYKIGVGLDNSNGLKLKLSVTEESVWLLAAEGGLSPIEIASYKKMVTFNTFVFDVYFALNEDGSFSQASVNLDIDAALTVPQIGLASAEGAGMALKVKGYLTVKAYSGSVTLPEELENYTDMTEMLEGMIGDGNNFPGELPF